MISETLDSDSEFKIEVKNKEKITLQEISLPIFLEQSSADGKNEGIIQAVVKNSKGEVVGNGNISEENLNPDIENKIAVENAKEITGNFSIVLTASGFSGDYPALYLSQERDIADKYVLKGTLYVNDKKSEGYPSLCMGVTHRDNLYYPALLIVTVVLVLVSIGGQLKKKYAVKRSLSETNRIKIISFAFVGGYLLFELWSRKPAELCSWIGPWYVLDYGVGIGSRLFIGSVMKMLFYDNFLDKSVAYYFVLTVLSILVILLAYMFAKCISNADGKYRKGIVFVILCYIASPGGVGHLWSEANLGRFEMYLLLLALGAIFINFVVQNRAVRYLLLTVISCAMFAIHQGNLFTYFSIIYMLCICNTFENDKIRWKDFVGSLVVGVTSAVTFLYFHFFSHVNFETLDEMAGYVYARTNIRNNIPGLQMEYFSGLYGMFDNCFAMDNYRIEGVIQLIILWPLVALGFWIWKNAFGKLRENRRKIFLSPYPYLLIFNLIYIPLFTFECDWGRWFATIITTKTIEILYLFYVRDDGIVCAIGKLNDFLKDKAFAVAMVLLYLASMEKFGSARFLDVVDKIYVRLFPFIS